MKNLFKIQLVLALFLSVAFSDLSHDYTEDQDYQRELDEQRMEEFTPRFLQTGDNGTIDLTSPAGGTGDLNVIDSPVDISTLDQLGTAAEQPQGIVNISDDSEAEHNRNYVKISSDLKAYEDAYKACLDNISDSDFAMETIEKCVGVDYQFVYDDIDYERRKILARADNTIRMDMIKICYNEAGADLVMDNACDLVQKDALDLMWDELNFEILIEYHREKYVFVHSKMPDATFTNVINRFKDIYKELAELIDELYAHRDLTIARLKRTIDERTAIIAEKFRHQAEHPTPKLQKDTISIDETLIDHPSYHIPLDSLPGPMIENGAGQQYAVNGNPWAETFAHNIGPDHYASINNPYEQPDFSDPEVNVYDPNNLFDSDFWFKKRKLARGQVATNPRNAVRNPGQKRVMRIRQIPRANALNKRAVLFRPQKKLLNVPNKNMPAMKNRQIRRNQNLGQAQIRRGNRI